MTYLNFNHLNSTRFTAFDLQPNIRECNSVIKRDPTVLSSHLRLFLPSDHFMFGLSTNISKLFLTSPIRATFRVIKYGEDYKIFRFIIAQLYAPRFLPYVTMFSLGPSETPPVFLLRLQIKFWRSGIYCPFNITLTSTSRF
jgi:hypothetical protein